MQMEVTDATDVGRCEECRWRQWTWVEARDVKCEQNSTDKRNGIAYCHIFLGETLLHLILIFVDFIQGQVIVTC